MFAVNRLSFDATGHAHSPSSVLALPTDPSMAAVLPAYIPVALRASCHTFEKQNVRAMQQLRCQLKSGA
jgi:hypothetical protein